MGIISYSGSAQGVQDLVADGSVISQKLKALEWPAATGDATARSSNAAAALALTRAMFERRSNPMRTSPVAVVVTDGTPTSNRLLDSEVRQLKAMGVRVTLVVPGPG